MTKTEREMWDSWVESEHILTAIDSQESLIIPMDLYIRKLERELQGLKSKKVIAAILQRTV